ncbi:MAG: flagellar filament capping protein FliD [Gammaproteobacteria bacterium]|nr:flagellar filament capping protein FliD [Gammaproteobacteria bacterium]
MALSVGGVGSGLDVNSIVTQLMTLERKPLTLLQKQEKSLNTELSAYGKLKSALSTFQTAVTNLSTSSGFAKFSATSADTTKFTATADSTAVAATYNVRVVQLAQAHKVSATGVYAAQQGSFNITSGTNTFGVTIDATNNSLTGIRDAINNAAGNTSVSASIINDVTGNKLVLTAKSTGAASAISAVDTAGAVAATLSFATVTNFAAQDAQITVDGFTVNSASNTVTGAITGVTLTLNQTDTVAKTLTVGRDVATIKGDIQKFIDAYNGVINTIRDLGGKTGTLSGDSGLLTVERGIRDVLNTAATGLSFSYLSDIGISTQKDGTLSINSAKLDTQLGTDFNGVVNLFSNATQGFAARFKSKVSDWTVANGMIAGREDGINARISSVKDRQTALEYRLTLIEQRYKKQFTALDSLVSSLQNTSNSLAQQLANLPKR